MQHFSEVTAATVWQIPVEWFVLVGSFVEELISPIPSAVVLVPAGASLQLAGDSAWYVLIIAIIAAIGRLPAALGLYWLASFARPQLFTKRFRWLGVKKAKLEQLQRRLGARRGGWALFAMWAIPVFPGLALSLASGFLKLPIAIFVSATFVGSIINAVIYLYLGYLGLKALAVLQALELGGQVVALLLLALIVAYVIKRRLA